MSTVVDCLFCGAGLSSKKSKVNHLKVIQSSQPGEPSPFLAALSSFRSLVVGRSVGPFVHLCEKKLPSEYQMVTKTYLPTYVIVVIVVRVVTLVTVVTIATVVTEGYNPII